VKEKVIMKNFGLLAGLIALVGTTSMARADNPDGLWKMGDLTVKVVTCQTDHLCGTIYSVGAKLNADGTPKLDWKNPNPALRKRSIVGVPVFQGLTPDGDNKWKGYIYSADDGGTYRAYAALKGSAMDVQGCWGPFCKTLNFKRIK
jgi:uncharacterized protein (DUF2147 family)